MCLSVTNADMKLTGLLMTMHPFVIQHQKYRNVMSVSNAYYIAHVKENKNEYP